MLVINTVDIDDSHPTGYTKIYKNGHVRDQDALTSFATVPGGWNRTLPYCHSQLQVVLSGRCREGRDI